MKRVLGNMILALCFLLVSGFQTQSFAALEERSDPDFGAGSITYDSATGLEWLDVDFSANLSYNFVSNQFGEEGDFEGFRYATHQEVLDFLAEAGISLIDELITNPIVVTACQNFIELVGPTGNFNGYPAVWGINGTESPSGSAVFYRSVQINGYLWEGEVSYLVATGANYNELYNYDLLGHWLVRETVVDPEVMLQKLSEFVISLNIKQGISNSFDAKLSSALKALDDLNENNDVAAINSLNAFINAVEAQRGKEISEADADSLISQTQAIIDLLSQ